MTLHDLRHEVLCHYLSKKFGWDDKLCRQITTEHPTIHHRSFTWIKRTINVLRDWFKISAEKVQNNPIFDHYVCVKSY